jgi:hypothetical protein
MILITTLYTPCDSHRIAEYVASLKNNLTNSCFDQVKVLLQTKDKDDYGFLREVNHEKLEIIQTDRRPFFSDLFAIANQCEDGKVIVICNGDIYFDENSNLERANEINQHQFWNLSRYEEQDEGKWALFDQAYEGSYDCWIFRTPLCPFPAGYHLGVLGCDTFLAQRTVEAGFLVSNPCLSIQPRHLHRIDIRNNTLSKDGKSYWQDAEYLPLGIQAYCATPSTLESLTSCSNKSPRYLLMNILGRWILPIYRLSFVQKQLANIRERSGA